MVFSIESAVCCKQANPANAIAMTHHAVSCQLRHSHVNKYKRSQLRDFAILTHTPWCVIMRAQLLASSRGRCFKSSSANIAPSVSKTWTLQLQADGNLVLLDGRSAVTWSSHTTGRGARLDMLWSGNLVIVDKAESIVFQTSTGAHAAAYARLHDSGLLALYWQGTLLWSAPS